MSSRRKVEPGIYRRTTSTGRVVYDAQVTLPREDGQAHARQVSKSCRTVAEARKWRRTTQAAALDTGTYVKPRRDLTVDRFLDEWLAGRRDLKPSSVATVANNLRPARAAFGSRTLQSITPGDVDRMLTAMATTGSSRRPGGLSPQTCNMARATLKAAFAVAVKRGLVSRNPAADVEAFTVPTADPGDYVWTGEHVAAFRASVADDPWFGGWVLSALGMRLGEVTALRWDDVAFADDGTGLVTVSRNRVAVGAVIHEGTTKNGKSRTLPIGPAVVAALRATSARQSEAKLAAGEAYVASGYVLTDAAGGPVRPGAYQRAFGAHVRAAGLPPSTLHQFRHSAVGVMLAAGVAPELVAMWLGHDPRQTLGTYWRPRTDEVAAAGAALSAVVMGS
ncbi:hypothetical protein ASG88_09665 [Nocardioides sp. Soil777]|uniref:tyrosine-type recombinase/integrase n=1 Tax=Nocardioides sp. Soil777 TaxID=1736409 RepID=UPI000702FEC3|nr:tyrosine-type recombinase/integrase [Nocardioides sp. Soil777]KRF00707.1 hypothetical protein ASG88_09665 [Nocardioides sp. Soil777]